MKKNSCDNLLPASIFLFWCRHTYSHCYTSYCKRKTLWYGNRAARNLFQKRHEGCFVSWRSWGLLYWKSKCYTTLIISYTFVIIFFSFAINSKEILFSLNMTVIITTIGKLIKNVISYITWLMSNVLKYILICPFLEKITELKILGRHENLWLGN